MSDISEKKDWTKPAAMAIPKEGFFKKEEGRYGPDLSKDSRLLWLHNHSKN